jgi:hypothetical protein
MLWVWRALLPPFTARAAAACSGGSRELDMRGLATARECGETGEGLHVSVTADQRLSADLWWRETGQARRQVWWFRERESASSAVDTGTETGVVCRRREWMQSLQNYSHIQGRQRSAEGVLAERPARAGVCRWFRRLPAQVDEVINRATMLEECMIRSRIGSAMFVQRPAGVDGGKEPSPRSVCHSPALLVSTTRRQSMWPASLQRARLLPRKHGPGATTSVLQVSLRLALLWKEQPCLASSANFVRWARTPTTTGVSLRGMLLILHQVSATNHARSTNRLVQRCQDAASIMIRALGIHRRVRHVRHTHSRVWSCRRRWCRVYKQASSMLSSEGAHRPIRHRPAPWEKRSSVIPCGT